LYCYDTHGAYGVGPWRRPRPTQGCGAIKKEEVDKEGSLSDSICLSFGGVSEETKYSSRLVKIKTIILDAGV
jgi:hypothetical protein